MSKKMKKVASVSAPPYGDGVMYEDAKARLKHQTLLQDYQDLQKEVDVMKSRLDGAKQRKLMLLAQVRFLHQRHKYLTQSMNRPIEQPPSIGKKRKLSTKGRVSHKNETAILKLPPLPDLKPKGRAFTGKEGAVRNMTAVHSGKLSSHSGKEVTQPSSTPISDHWNRIYGGKEAAGRYADPAINLNQNEILHGCNISGSGIRRPTFDLNQDTSLVANDATLPSRAPIFDLNEISTEDEVYDDYEHLKFEEPRKDLIRAGNEEQSNDLKLSICRNSGEGSSRIGKRKISWQDHVALRV